MARAPHAEAHFATVSSIRSIEAQQAQPASRYSNQPSSDLLTRSITPNPMAAADKKAPTKCQGVVDQLRMTANPESIPPRRSQADRHFENLIINPNVLTTVRRCTCAARSEEDHHTKDGVEARGDHPDHSPPYSAVSNGTRDNQAYGNEQEGYAHRPRLTSYRSRYLLCPTSFCTLGPPICWSGLLDVLPLHKPASGDADYHRDKQHQIERLYCPHQHPIFSLEL